MLFIFRATTMLFTCIVVGYLLSVGGVWGQQRLEKACYAASTCGFMQLSCSNSSRIFIFKLLYGSKPSNSSCSGTQTCEPSCCEEITSFHRNTVISAPAVAIRYESSDVTNYPVASGDSQTWHCQVDTADCVQRQADVILVKENYTGSSNCSSVGWSGGSFLPCVPDFQYESFTTSTPFSVSVNVFQNQRQPNGWVAVRAQDGSSLVVTCGYTDGQLAASSPCQDSSAAAPTTSPSLTSQGAMVAGWVVAAVLAVLLAALIVLLLRRHGGCRGAIQFLRGKPSSHHPATAPRDQNADVNYLHVIPDPTQAAQQARRAPTYVNAAPRHNGPDGEHVNAAAEQSRPVSQQEYSPLEWSPDQATTYSSLKMAKP